MRIIVTGLVGLHPVGGVAWDYLQYAVGLARLGHDVYYHEDTWSWPYHPIEKRQTESGVYSANYINEFFQRFAPGMVGRWHYLHLHEKSYGMERRFFDEIARTADLFINVSGASSIPDALSPKCTKVFLDTDPGYNQIVLSEKFSWSENVERWCALVAQHDRHFTYAENINDPDCAVPKVGFDWQPTRMPVVLGLWSDMQPKISHSAPWTTVMTWNAFKGPVIYQGMEYKSKGAEFEKFMQLPQLVDSPFMVAVGGINAPIGKLRANGWGVLDAPSATLSPQAYQDFIGSSRGEFSTAKHIYVATKSGWFSCRTACYLAVGRPAVVQDTGFSKTIPVSMGLLAFSTLEEAKAAIQSVENDYQRHASMAIEVAHEYFDSSRVLSEFIDTAMTIPGRAQLEAGL